MSLWTAYNLVMLAELNYRLFCHGSDVTSAFPARVGDFWQPRQALVVVDPPHLVSTGVSIHSTSFTKRGKKQVTSHLIIRNSVAVR